MRVRLAGSLLKKLKQYERDENAILAWLASTKGLQ
jgi:hypothetical protein